MTPTPCRAKINSDYFAQGALVVGLGSPAGAGPAEDDPAHGARVGAMGPGGNRDVSGRLDRFGPVETPPRPSPPLLVAHGAAVPIPPGDAACVALVPDAQGALVPD